MGSASPSPALPMPHDAELLSRSRRTATGGWVVRLTDAPLDLAPPAQFHSRSSLEGARPIAEGNATVGLGEPDGILIVALSFFLNLIFNQTHLLTNPSPHLYAHMLGPRLKQWQQGL